MPLPDQGARGPRSRGRHRADARSRARHARPADPARRAPLTAGVAGAVAVALVAGAGWSAASTSVAQAKALSRLVSTAAAQAPAPAALATAPPSAGPALPAVDLGPGPRPGDDLPDKSLLAAARVAPATPRGAVVVARTPAPRATSPARPRKAPLPGWELGQTPPREVVRANVSVLAVVRRYFPASQVGNAMAVVDCESSQQWWQRGPVNRNGTRDWGLFQFNDGGTLQGTLTAIGVRWTSLRQAQALALNPEINTRMAIHLYRDRGWAPWVCAYTRGIVAALWSNEPGPMAGRYDVGGDPLPLAPPAPAPAPSPTTPRRPAPRPSPTPTVPRRPAPSPSAPSPSAPTTPAPAPSPTSPPPTAPPTATTPTPAATASGSAVGEGPAGS